MHLGVGPPPTRYPQEVSISPHGERLRAWFWRRLKGLTEAFQTTPGSFSEAFTISRYGLVLRRQICVILNHCVVFGNFPKPGSSETGVGRSRTRVLRCLKSNQITRYFFGLKSNQITNFSNQIGALPPQKKNWLQTKSNQIMI